MDFSGAYSGSMKVSRIVVALLWLSALQAYVIAQESPAVLSVAAARQGAAQLGSKEISVKGHLWCGKEGSMIYDSYFKATLRLKYSSAYIAKHPGLYQFLISSTRTSNVATVTGRLITDGVGKLYLTADEIQFSQAAK